MPSGAPVIRAGILHSRLAPMTSAGPAILVVDDDAAIRSLLAAVCRRVGYGCDSAADGQVALEKIRSTIYDVILLDLMMPHLNGFQVIAALREMPVRPAVIVMSAQGPKQTDPLQDDPVVTAVLTKPFDLDMLSSVLTDTARSMFERRSRK